MNVNSIANHESSNTKVFPLASYNYSTVDSSRITAHWNEYYFRNNETLQFEIVAVTNPKNCVTVNIISVLSGKRSCIESIVLRDSSSLSQTKTWVVAKAPFIGIKHPVTIMEDEMSITEYRHIELRFTEYRDFEDIIGSLTLLEVTVVLTPLPLASPAFIHNTAHSAYERTTAQITAGQSASAHSTSTPLLEHRAEHRAEIKSKTDSHDTSENCKETTTSNTPTKITSESIDLRSQIQALIKDESFWSFVDMVDYVWTDMMRV